MEIEQKLNTVDLIIQECRREVNNLLHKYVKYTTSHLENPEDLMRLVGELNCAHNHIQASLIDEDHDIYCILKHLSTSIILAGECYNPVMKRLYGALGILSDGKLRPCSACRREEDEESEV